MEYYSNMQKASLLIEQRRFRDAEDLIRSELERSPENAHALVLLALALSAQEKHAEALGPASRAVGIAPFYPFGFYVLALVLHHLDQEKEALSVIQQALRMEPGNAIYHHLHGNILAAMSNWQEALAAARKGLALAPEDVDCKNLEARALVFLGEQDVAEHIITTNLMQDPENAHTFANLGWSELHAGKYGQALEHFKEALRINPNYEWARVGVIEALKARNGIYRPILRYLLWMNRLSGQTRWALVIGLWVFTRLLSQIAKTNPGLASVITPVIYLYIAFVYISWISRPLFNLFLRLDKFGRLALSREEISNSNWLGLCVFSGVGILGAGWLTHSGLLQLVGLMALGMAFPVAALFYRHKKASRRIIIAYCIGLLLLGIATVFMAFYDPARVDSFAYFYLLGIVLFTWLANFLG
jgi:tetratricopeptide (TPR) repeat protein